MAIEFLCRKVGMTQLFTESGDCIPVTVLDAQPNRVVQVKTPEKEGYAALQLGAGQRSPGRTPKAQRGHFEKAGVAPARHVRESRVGADEVASYEVGQEITVDVFSAGQRVDVIGTSKGRGTAGVVKRHGFAIKRQTHGTHEFFRHGGSIGAGAFPGKVVKGLRMAGRHGNERVTALNLEIVRVDPERNLLFVKGGVPGHNDAWVRVRQTVRARD